jgi:Tfp pilus assembly protein PilX
MKTTAKRPYGGRPGSTLVLVLIFIGMFSALAVAMATMAGVNVQVAGNYQKLDHARAAAESGLEVMRYWLSQVAMSGTTEPSQRFSLLASSLQAALTNAGVGNLVPSAGSSTITFSNVPLGNSGQTFSASLTKIDNANVRLDVTGYDGPINRTVRANYVMGTRAHTVFDFGVASRGPISLSGNVDLEGVNIDVESNAFIVSEHALLALSIIGNSMIAGDVKIVNPLAYVHLQGGHAGVGGQTGAAAMNHITIGVAPTEFPEMNPQQFYSYATNDLSPTANLSSNATYENLRIPAGRNPRFTGNVTLRGVTLVEAPNVVSFAGGVDITGIIVTNGSETDNSGTNEINFTGNVTSHPIGTLPQQPQFQGLHSQTGTFMLAPGFKASFGGSFSTVSGAIAANGIRFYGNAGGTINGSIVNYSEAMMELSGNSDLRFNRSGLTQVPAGFVPEIIMQYDPSSYAEVTL